MAYTVTKSQMTVFGNQVVWQGVVTADAATGVVSFGLASIDHISAAPKSCSTAFAANFKCNEDSSGAASVGSLGISGVVSGDDFYITVYGR